MPGSLCSHGGQPPYLLAITHVVLVAHVLVRTPSFVLVVALSLGELLIRDLDPSQVRPTVRHMSMVVRDLVRRLKSQLVHVDLAGDRPFVVFVKCFPLELHLAANCGVRRPLGDFVSGLFGPKGQVWVHGDTLADLVQPAVCCAPESLAAVPGQPLPPASPSARAVVASHHCPDATFLHIRSTD